MKHLNYSLLVCAVGAMMLCSCNTRQAAINNLRSFNTELQAEANFYDLGDWKKAGKRYVRINKKLLKHSYNQEEMAEIGRLQGECHVGQDRGSCKSPERIVGRAFWEIMLS